MVAEESILKTVKEGLDISPDDPSFDGSLLTAINARFADLYDLGFGPDAGFKIQDATEEWDALEENPIDTEAIKFWMIQKVKKTFDPPETGPLMSALDKVIEEAEWRMTNRRDGDKYALSQVTP